jgi:hypothetical protein
MGYKLEKRQACRKGWTLRDVTEDKRIAKVPCRTLFERTVAEGWRQEGKKKYG